MSDLVAFLAARLDEDEAKAALTLRAATAHFGPRFKAAPRERWERVLREVEAGRRLIGRYEYCAAYGEAPGNEGLWHAMREYEEHILPAMAAVWSGHPDYDPEWAPQAAGASPAR